MRIYLESFEASQNEVSYLKLIFSDILIILNGFIERIRGKFKGIQCFDYFNSFLAKILLIQLLSNRYLSIS